MDKLKTYFRFSLPILFTVYVGFLIAFTHVHIVNGVTIVHSHPYQKSDGAAAEHEHNYAEFQLLHQISTIEIAGALLTLFLFGALFTLVRNIRYILPISVHTSPDKISFTLRGPPINL